MYIHTCTRPYRQKYVACYVEYNNTNSKQNVVFDGNIYTAINLLFCSFWNTNIVKRSVVQRCFPQILTFISKWFSYTPPPTPQTNTLLLQKNKFLLYTQQFCLLRYSSQNPLQLTDLHFERKLPSLSPMGGGEGWEREALFISAKFLKLDFFFLLNFALGISL